MRLLKKSKIELLVIVTSIFFILNCTKSAEITKDTGLYSDPDLKTKIADLSKGSVITALDYRNHKWNVREFIKIKSEKGEGYISPTSAVVGQIPETSVFKTGYKKDYKPFYDPSDKVRYRNGYEFSTLAKLPKEKIPLEELIK